MPACWEHWNVLPEDLRSFIVISYGRGRTKAYGEGLMEAVRLWRLTGNWRLRTAPAPRAAETHAKPRSDRKVISLVALRQKIASRPTQHHVAAAPEERALSALP